MAQKRYGRNMSYTDSEWVFDDLMRDRFNRSGWPDRVIVAKGKLLAVEIKAGNSKLSGSQRVLADIIIQSGGVFIVFRLLRDANDKWFFTISQYLDSEKESIIGLTLNEFIDLSGLTRYTLPHRRELINLKGMTPQEIAGSSINWPDTRLIHGPVYEVPPHLIGYQSHPH